jgi:hypothetical protein
MMIARRATIAVGVLLLFVMSELLAQTNVTGYISGRVVNKVSEAVEGAQVTAVRVKTGIRRTIVTSAEGGFRFAALPVGEYTLMIEAEGFQSAERGPIVLSIGGATRLEVSLLSEDDVVEFDTLEVVGNRISTIDVDSVESTTIITDAALSRLPVARNLEGVALLAPGTTRSPVFGLVGFGGASVAENGYYLNGMNLTNFRDGMGFSSPPFEFYSQFEVKTGGYGAEFGRSTGGVVNAVSKSGGDTYKFGTAVFWEPDALRESSPNMKDLNPRPDFDYIHYTSPKDSSESLKLQLDGSGPLIEDHLFFYALVEFSQYDEYTQSSPSSTYGLDVYSADDASNDNTFWGLKLDWHINPGHLIEFTAFSDTSTGIVHYSEVTDFESGELEFLGNRYSDEGGENYILRYTGYYGQALTLSVLAGQNDYERTERSDTDHIPVTFDWRAGYPLFPTPWVNFRVGTSSDQRRMFRFDGEWDVGNHLLRFGLDYEENTTDDHSEYSGGVYWQYFDAEPGEYFGPGGFVVPEGVTQVVQERINIRGGGFEVRNSALYIEDHWRLGERWLLYGGIRRETFDNRNAVGETFVEMNDQWAPRLGFSWDVKGDLSGKLYGTAGRYFLPMPTRVNMNLSGAWLLTLDWFALTDLNSDGTPIKGDLLANYTIFDGTVPDTTELLDTNLDPTYQDEFILGYVWEVSRGWSLGVRGIYRDLKNVIEDVSFGRLLNGYALDNGYDDFWVPPDNTYVLTNPGTNASLLWDLDYDGSYEEVSFSAAETGLQKVKRTYKALELYFERTWRDGWALQGSYTRSESRGNYEGWTDSYSGQADGPLMSAFDIPEVMEGAYGKLASDRPHTLKLFGSWNFANQWQVSGNFLFQSGVAYGARGCHPNPEVGYGCQFFYDGDELVPRGSRGRSDDIYQMDLGLQYSLPVRYQDGHFYLRADVFNVFNADTETGRFEDTQTGGGESNLNYDRPSGFQQPRYVRLSARLEF